MTIEHHQDDARAIIATPTEDALPRRFGLVLSQFTVYRENSILGNAAGEVDLNGGTNGGGNSCLAPPTCP